MLRPPTEQKQGHNQRVESKNKVVIKVYLHYINLKSYNDLQVELMSLLNTTRQIIKYLLSYLPLSM